MRAGAAGDGAGSARISTSGASRFLDTNVLVYAFDQDAPENAARAREILSTPGAVVSTQVLQEFYVVARKKLGLAAPDAREAVAGFSRACRVVTIEVPTILAAADLCARQPLAFGDALILEAAVAAGCRVVLSEDMSDGGAYGTTVRVENPFAPPAARAARPKPRSRETDPPRRR